MSRMVTCFDQSAANFEAPPLTRGGCSVLRELTGSTRALGSFKRPMASNPFLKAVSKIL